MHILRLSLLVIGFICSNVALGQDFGRIDSIAKVLIEKYQVRGIAITGIHKGKTIYTKTFGHADEQQPLTTATHLYIASNTKAFTGLAMAQLIDQKRIAIDDPINKYIPAGLFPDSIATGNIRIRHLLAHTHGLSNDPLNFSTSYAGITNGQENKLLQFTSYRGGTQHHKFRYSNLGYLLAGMVIEMVTGQSWQQYIQHHILQPLKMSHTQATVPATGTVALPYRFQHEALSSKKTANTLHAAGGLFSTTSDMATWLAFVSDSTKGLGASSSLYQLYHTPLVPVGESMGPFKFDNYSFGWINGRLLDRNLRFHTGSFPGYESFMSYVPGGQTGVFVFVNEKEAGIRIAGLLTALYYNLLFQEEGTDALENNFMAQVEKIYTNYKPFNAPLMQTGQLDIKPGSYHSKAYGTLIVSAKNGTYRFTLGNLSSPAYASETAGEILVSWTPGIIEHFFLENNGNTLRYDDFGKFVRVAQ